jgi:hypothetical protein
MQTLTERLLLAMGRELAAVHLGVADRSRAILRHLDKRAGDAWLAKAAQDMARLTRADLKAYASR